MGYRFSGFPNKIKIGPFEFKIEFAESLNDGGVPLWGLYSPSVSKIYYLREVPCPASAVDVVLHEIGHGVLANAGLTGNDLREEHVVSAFSTGLTEVFRDNPKLVSWLTKTLRRR